MHKSLKQYENWFGDWVGEGETFDEQPTRVFARFSSEMSGHLVRMEIHTLHAETNELLHGVLSYSCPQDDGTRKSCCYTTVHGNVIFHVPQDDEGVAPVDGLNTMGEGVRGSLVLISDDELLMTGYWGPEPLTSDNYVGKETVTLKRLGQK